MQLLAFFVQLALIASVACDVECFKKDAAKCNEEVFKLDPSNLEFDFCKLQRGVMQCITDSAVNCNMKFVSEAKRIQSVLAEMCEEGSKLNKAIEKNRKCILKSITDIKCIESITKIVGGNPTPKKLLKAQKEGCKQMNAIASCTTKKVKENCDSDGLAAFRTLYEPSMELHKRVCEDVILPEGQDESNTRTKTKLPVFYGPLEFII